MLEDWKKPVGTGGSICFQIWDLHPRSLTARPWKVTETQTESSLKNNHRFSGAMLNFRCVLYLIWGSFSYESRLVMTDAYMCLFVSLQEQLIHFRGRMNPPAFRWSKVARLHFQWIKTVPRSIISYCLRYLYKKYYIDIDVEIFYTIYPALTSCGQEDAFNISLDVECMAEYLYRNCWKNIHGPSGLSLVCPHRSWSKKTCITRKMVVILGWRPLNLQPQYIHLKHIDGVFWGYIILF